MSVQRKEKGKGFTIIEVVLVLAIGALIFLMALLAFPALQRSQRDTQRKNDLAKMSTAVSSYQSNNRNALPNAFGSAATAGTWQNMVSRYITQNGTQEYNDPSGGAYVIAPDTNPGNPLAGPFDADNSKIYVATGRTCNGEVTKPAGTRQVTFRILLEGNGVACVNN